MHLVVDIAVFAVDVVLSYKWSNFSNCKCWTHMNALAKLSKNALASMTPSRVIKKNIGVHNFVIAFTSVSVWTFLQNAFIPPSSRRFSPNFDSPFRFCEYTVHSHIRFPNIRCNFGVCVWWTFSVVVAAASRTTAQTNQFSLTVIKCQQDFYVLTLYVHESSSTSYLYRMAFFLSLLFRNTFRDMHTFANCSCNNLLSYFIIFSFTFYFLFIRYDSFDIRLFLLVVVSRCKHWLGIILFRIISSYKLIRSLLSKKLYQCMHVWCTRYDRNINSSATVYI